MDRSLACHPADRDSLRCEDERPAWRAHQYADRSNHAPVRPPVHGPEQGAGYLGSPARADVVFTNFEATIAEPGQPNDSAPRQGPGFAAPPGAFDALKALGFNLIATANNHANDLKVRAS